MSGRRPVSVGGASLFAVLIILCLMIFAVLARLTAQSELNLAERAGESVSAYYEADYRANIRLAELRSEVSSSRYPGQEIAFTEPIDENRELSVRLTVGDDGKLIITEWAAVRLGSPEPETGNTGMIIF